MVLHYTVSTNTLAYPGRFSECVCTAQKLLNFMNDKNMKATFFVVGSRVLEYPQLLVEEYMAGHEISVHTWAHPVGQDRDCSITMC